MVDYVGVRTTWVYCGAERCRSDRAMPKTARILDDKTARLSVSLTAEQHRELNEIARKNRVSVAWVVREAVSRLLKDELPLLHVGKE